MLALSSVFLLVIAVWPSIVSFTINNYRLQSSRFSSLYLSPPNTNVIDISSSRGFTPVISSSFISSQLSATTTEDLNTENIILKQIDTWACVKSCGACCKLGPLSSRPDLKDYLTQEEFVTYTSMVGEDDWCTNYDKTNRMCTIYDTRPSFCRVEPKSFEKMFDVKREDFADFCGFCCTENISDVYGEDSIEMQRFTEIYESLNPDDYQEDGSEDIIIDPKSTQLSDLTEDDR